MPRMRRSIATAIIAASVAAGGLAGAVLGTPTLAGAAETATGTVTWVQEALRALVDDGTITQEQAGAVETALVEARPERRFGPRGFGGPVALPAVAEALGMSEEELRTALGDGQTIADIAAGRGVEVQTVVDAIVAAHRERLDEKVASGELTREQADEMLTHAEERAAAFVNGEPPAFHGRPHGGPRGGPHGSPRGHGGPGRGGPGAGEGRGGSDG